MTRTLSLYKRTSFLKSNADKIGKKTHANFLYTKLFISHTRV